MGQSRASEVIPATKAIDGNERTAPIRRDIERTRAEMSATVDAIEERLSPVHLKEQVTEVKEHVLEEIRDAKDRLKADISHDFNDAKDRVKGEIQEARASVREATIGRVEHMFERASDRARDTGNTFMTTIRANPIPAVMVGLGLSWLLLAPEARPRRRFAREEIYGEVPWDESEDPERGRVGRAVDYTREGLSQAAAATQEKLGEAKQGASEFMHRAEDRARGAAREAKATTRRVGHEVRDKAAHYADVSKRQIMRAERGAEHIAEENPLAAGALVFALGAAIGLALPHTEREDRWMGDMKRRLNRRLEGTARQALDRVEEGAKDVLQSSPRI